MTFFPLNGSPPIFYHELGWNDGIFLEDISDFFGILVGDDTIRCGATHPWVTPLKRGQSGEIPERIRLKPLAAWQGLSNLMTKKLIL